MKEGEDDKYFLGGRVDYLCACRVEGRGLLKGNCWDPRSTASEYRLV